MCVMISKLWIIKPCTNIYTQVNKGYPSFFV